MAARWPCSPRQTGTETAALGRWWEVALDETGAVRLVGQPSDWTRMNADERGQDLVSPRSSALVSVPLSAGAINALTPPATIRVAHHPLNGCRDLADWAVTVVPFEEYVARVLPAEVYTSWPAATLQAQAIAIRTFAWRKILTARPDAIYDITDWTVDQVMCDNLYAATDAAVAATVGRYLAYEGQIILAQYSAENGHPTADGGLPYLKPVLDPVSLGKARRGHGRGLSQWGAQRWAAFYGWNATQILTHYYTAAQIVDPLGRDPALSLTRPWPGAWLTGSTASLAAHASFPATATVTLTLTAPGWQRAADFGILPGLWSAEWPLPAALTRPVTITASALTQSITYTHAFTLAGEDRLPPTAQQITLPASSPSLTITLRLSATDAGTSGLAGVAAGGNWQAAAADFTWRSGAGALGADPAALNGQALLLPAGVASRWEAALRQPLALDQIYQAYVRLRITDDAPGASRPDAQRAGAPGTLARIELFDPVSTALLGFADLRAGDFRQIGLYQEFPIDFWLAPAASGELGLRLITMEYPIPHTQSPISLDRILILRGPQPFSANLPYRIERRAGPQTVVVKVLDGAGNPSAELTSTVQLLDTTPPSGWQLLAPTGWVTTTQRPTVTVRVADELTGVDPASAAVRFTTDAGLSWSAWEAVSATAQPDGSAVLTWVWPAGEGDARHRAQFRAADNEGLMAFSPAWPIRVDTEPPQVTLAVPDAVSAGRWFIVRWEGRDEVGVSSFDVQVMESNVPGASRTDALRAEVPGTSTETWVDWLRETTATEAYYLAPVAGKISFRIRARDLAGNLGPWSAGQTVLAQKASVFMPLVTDR